MKKVSNFITLVSCLSPVAAIPFISLTSCGQTMITEIDVQHRLQTGSATSYLLPFKMSKAPLTPVHVKILGDTSNYLSLEQSVFDLQLTKKNATIKVNISELCTKSTHFNFKLQFWFTNFLRKDEKIVVDDCNIYYDYAPEVKTDQVRSERLMIEQTNNYTFDFALQFSAMPNSKVFAFLDGDKTGQLFLPDEGLLGYEVEVQIEDGYYVAHIPVNVDRSQDETQVFTFSLEILFVNSFGIGQDVILDNLAASFVYNPNDVTLPTGFLEYKKVNGRLILTGINKQVVDPETTFPKYHTIIIPEGVTDIGADALTDRNLFANVTKIVFPQSLRVIESGSLRGCFNIQEMDVTSSESFIPTWMYNDSDIFGNLEANDNNVCEAGNVWIGDQSNRVEINKLLYNNVHMPSLWKSFSEEAIMPEEFFDIQGSKLVSIKTTYWRQLENYQVVKIPDYITELGENCLRPLGYYPAINPDSTSDNDKCITRRLVLNKELEKIDDGALMETDLGGPLNICCPKLESIGANAFNRCTRNFYRKYYRQDSINEKLYISFLNSNKLTSIGENCFFHAGIHGTIDLPINLETINTNSFGMQRDDELEWRAEEVTKLVVHNKLINVQGTNSLAYMEMLWTIDVSDFETLPDWAKQGETNQVFYFNGLNFRQYAEKGTIICKSSLLDSWKQYFPTLLNVGLPYSIEDYYNFVAKD